MKIKFPPIAIWLIITGITTHAQDTLKFDPKKALFNFHGEQLNNKTGLLRYAALTRYREGVNPVKGQFNTNFEGYNDEKAGTRRIYMYNLSIQDMLTHGLIKRSQILLEVKDPSKYRYHHSYGPEIEWLRKNGYCYELLVPIGVLKGFQTIDKEIQRIFNVTARWEKRNVKTWVLIRTSTAEKFKTAGQETIKDPVRGVYRNVNIGWIGVPLNELGPVPFLDETGYKGMVDLDLGVDLTKVEDFDQLRKVLKKYDLDLKEEMREKQMFVITENNK